MSRIKYHYNSKTLRFEPYREKWSKRIFRIAFNIVAGMLFATTVLLIAYRYLDSPKEKRLRRELDLTQSQLKVLENQLNQMEEVIVDLEHRDDQIYRALFAAEPVSAEVRNSVNSGLNRYDRFKGLMLTDMLTEVTQKMDQLRKRAYVQTRSYDELWGLIQNKSEMLKSIPAIIPVDLSDLERLTSGFGYRIDPIYQTPKFHSGMDFVAELGTPVYATGNGVVSSAGLEAGGYGNCVRIRHGFGYETVYAHLMSVSVRSGMRVSRGQKIGLLGSTGKSTGPHLHYEVIHKGQPVNPVYFYYSDFSPEEYAKVVEQSNRPGQAMD
jgi:murein DD-endopeptidase MepM/ murein hydrolase activator NlpD